MTADEEIWNRLRESWSSYKKTVSQWLDVGAEPGTDQLGSDELIHRLIESHNDWSEQLGAAIDAVHHH